MTRADELAALGAFADLVASASPAGDDVAATIARTVSGRTVRTPAAQVEAYREQFWLRHVGSLLEDYVAVDALLGRDAFERLARAFLAAHPPSSWALRDDSAGLAEFAATTAPWSDDPRVADLARVEWACIDARDAEDAPPVDPAVVGAIAEDDWPKARLRFQPALRIVSLAHDAHVFREAIRSGAPEPRLSPRAVTVAYHRTPGGAGVDWREIDAGSAVLLALLLKGVPLGDACERAAATLGETAESFEEKLGAWFQSWTGSGWIVGIDVDDSVSRLS